LLFLDYFTAKYYILKLIYGILFTLIRGRLKVVEMYSFEKIFCICLQEGKHLGNDILRSHYISCSFNKQDPSHESSQYNIFVTL